MAFFQWSEDYSVGVKEFDEQHKQLIDMLNELYEAMSQGKGNEVLSRVLARLVDYTFYHFDGEIKKMEKYSYPGLDEHRLAHERLKEDVLRYKRDLESGNSMFSVELLHFLKDWLRGHIMGMDRKYTEFFHSNGVR